VSAKGPSASIFPKPDLGAGHLCVTGRDELTSKPMHLVDVKVCSVDDVWSGLKLVLGKEHR
jgi:hypothetical protein